MLANRSVLFLSLGLVGLLAAFYFALWWLYKRRWQAFGLKDGQEQDRRYYRDVGAVGILLGLVGGFFWRPLFNSAVTVPNGGGDLVSFFYPIHAFASASLRAGEIPLWNPHLFGGMPFAGDIQSGLFYPLNWLFWLAGEVTYEKVQMLALVHYWLAASFAYAFARSLNLGRWPALLAGTLYAFSGFAVSHLGHLPMLAAAAWFPLVLLAVNQAVRAPATGASGWRWAVAVGLFLAISFLAGHFQLFLYNFYGAAIFWLALAWRGRPAAGQARNYWLKQLLRGGLVGIVLGGAVLVQIWPFYEMGQLSIRSGISYEISTQFGVWPVGLVDLLLPNLFSPNPQEYFGYWSNSDVLGYMGLLVYGLVGFSILLRPIASPRFYPIFFLSLGLAGLIFALSGYTIFQGWFYQFVPALSLTRAAGRFLYWFNFGLAIAAAYGLQNWLHYRAQPVAPAAEKLLRWSWRSYALAVLAVLLIPTPLLYLEILKSPGSINDLVVRGLNGLLFASVVLGLGAVLLRLFYKRVLTPDVAAFLVLALVVFDLFSARATFNPVAADVASGFYHTETANFLRSQDPPGQYRLDASVGSIQQAWQANTAQLFGLNDVRGVFNPLQVASYETFWNAVAAAQKDFRALPAYTMLGARYVLARNKEDPTGPQFKLVYRDERPGVKLNAWENSQALGRGWLVHRTEILPEKDMLPLLVQPDFKPLEVAYLTNGKKLTDAATPLVGEEVRLVSQNTNRLVFSVTASSEAYLIVGQTWYPGWKATVDGATAPLEKANYTFGGIYLPTGQHKVELEFAPSSFWLALPVSLLTWLLAGGFLLVSGFLAYRSSRKKLPEIGAK